MYNLLSLVVAQRLPSVGGDFVVVCQRADEGFHCQLQRTCGTLDLVDRVGSERQEILLQLTLFTYGMISILKRG